MNVEPGATYSEYAQTFAHTVTIAGRARPRLYTIEALRKISRDPAQVDRHFTLSPGTVTTIIENHPPPPRFYIALFHQLVKATGRVWEPHEIPQPIQDHVARQVCVHPDVLKDIADRPGTIAKYQREALDRAHFRRFRERDRGTLLDHLSGVAMRVPRLTALTDLACDWLFQRRIVRPGETVLEDLVRQARSEANKRIDELFQSGLPPEQKEKFDRLLEVPEGQRTTAFERFTRPAARESAKSFQAIIEQVVELVGMEADGLNMGGMGPAKIRFFAKEAKREKAKGVSRRQGGSRYARMACYLVQSLTDRRDAGVEMFIKLMQRVHNLARKRADKAVLKQDISRREAVLEVAHFAEKGLDANVPVEERIPHALKGLSEEKIKRGIGILKGRTPDPDRNPVPYLEPFFTNARKFIPDFFKHLDIRFEDAQDPMKAAVGFLRQVHEAAAEGVRPAKEKKLWQEAPTEWIPEHLEKYVLTSDNVVLSPKRYEMTCCYLLAQKLKGNRAWVHGGHRFGLFENFLIELAEWIQDRERYYALLGLPLDVKEFLAWLRRLYDRQLRRAVAYIAREKRKADAILDAKGKWNLKRLEPLGPSPEADALGDRIYGRISLTALADMLIDTDNEIDLLRHFVLSVESNSRTKELRRNLIAAILAYGCNIGPKEMSDSLEGVGVWEIEGAFDRYLTEDNLKAATIEVVNAISRMELVHVWGDGKRSSSDGVVFALPLRVLQSEQSTRLRERGIVFYPTLSDQHSILYQQIIPVRLREALYALDALLQHDTDLDPRMNISDMHGATELIMAAGKMLGFELCPRLRGINRMKLYRFADSRVRGRLKKVLKGEINEEIIRKNYDAVVRVIASMKIRLVAPSLILHRLGTYAADHPLHQAMAEIGRVLKTIYVLKYATDPRFRREVEYDMDKNESSHTLTRNIFFGKFGESRLRDLEDQANSFSCLALLQNVVIRWTMMAMEKSIRAMEAEGQKVPIELLSRIYPTRFSHIRRYGRFKIDVERMKNR